MFEFNIDIGGVGWHGAQEIFGSVESVTCKIRRLTFDRKVIEDTKHNNHRIWREQGLKKVVLFMCLSNYTNFGVCGNVLQETKKH